MERATNVRSLSRRGMLRLAGAAGAGAGAIGAATGTASAVPTAPKGGFAHPALLHTQADCDRMAEKVKVGAWPWTDGWKRLLSSRDVVPWLRAAWWHPIVALVAVALLALLFSGVLTEAGRRIRRLVDRPADVPTPSGPGA